MESELRIALVQLAENTLFALDQANERVEDITRSRLDRVAADDEIGWLRALRKNLAEARQAQAELLDLVLREGENGINPS